MPKESHTHKSELSVAPLLSLADQQNKKTNPAFSVADVTFSTDNSLFSTARNISGHLIQYDDDEVINSLIVNVQTASLAPLLNPDTKEIAKSESNKIQQVEAKRWNTSAKQQIYGSSTGLFYKRIIGWPTITLLKEQEETSQARDCQARINTAFIAYQNTAQTIFNENTDKLVKYYR